MPRLKRVFVLQLKCSAFELDSSTQNAVFQCSVMQPNMLDS